MTDKPLGTVQPGTAPRVNPPAANLPRDLSDPDYLFYNLLNSGKFSDAGKKHYEDLRREKLQEQVGYEPSFWENPTRVARYHNMVQNAPKDWQKPDWLDVDAVNTAYDYMKFRNDDKPWYTWKYLNPDDPGRAYLQSLGQPPDDPAYIIDQKFGGLPLKEYEKPFQNTPTTAENLSANWEDMPTWQKFWLTIGMPTGGIEGRPDVSRVPAALVQGGLAALGGAGVGTMIAPGIGTVIGALALGVPTAALSFFGNPYVPVLSDVLSVFNVGAVEAMKVYGTVKQVGGSLIDPEVYGSFEEVMNSLPEAYKASMASYLTERNWLLEGSALLAGDEAAGEGKVWQFQKGITEPVAVDNIGTTALVEFRRRLVDGEDFNSLYAEYVDKYGFSGTLNDFLYQSIADPLQLAPYVGSRGGAKFTKALAAKTGDAGIARLASEFEAGKGSLLIDILPMGLNTLAEKVTGLHGSTGLIPTWRNYKNSIRKNFGIGDSRPASELTAFEKFAGNLTEEGKWRELEPTTEPRKGLAGWWDYLSQNTNDSKARLFLFAMHDGVAKMLSDAGSDPAQMNRVLEAAANQDTAAIGEIGKRVMDSPQIATIAVGLKEALREGQHTRMLADWVQNEPRRALLLKLAEATGKSPAAVLDAIKADANKFASDLMNLARQNPTDTRFRDLANDLQTGTDLTATANAIKDRLAPFTAKNPSPWSPDQYQAELTNHIWKQADDFLKARYNLKQDATVFRFAQTLKSLQSLVLLGLNPAYFINNAVNNMVTRAANGVFGFMTNNQINEWWQAMGYEPSRLGVGIGAAGEGAVAAGLDAVGRLTSGDGTLTKINRELGKLNKLGIFSRLSSRFEGFESRQAYTIGAKRWWDRNWRRGVGFSKMDAGLEARLKAINPDLPGLIYGLVEAGLNPDGITEKIMQGAIIREASSYIDEAANKLYPNNPAFARDLLNMTGFGQELGTRMRGVNTREGVERVFRDMDDRIQEWIDIRMAQAIADQAGNAAAQIQSAGASAILPLYTQMAERTLSGWINHLNGWANVFAETANMDSSQRGARIRAYAAETSAEWRRIHAFERQTHRGIASTLGIGDPTSAEFFRLLDSEHQLWERFYDGFDEDVNGVSQHTPGVNELYREFFSRDYDNYEARSVAWDTLQARMNELYEAAVRREQSISMAMDEAVEGMWERFTGRPAEDVTLWRSNVRAIRDEMTAGMRAFRDMLRQTNPSADVRRQLWAQFMEENYRPLIYRLYHQEIIGATRLAGQEPPPLDDPGGPQPTRPTPQGPTPAAGDIPPAEGGVPPSVNQVASPPIDLTPAQIIRNLAREFGIPTADINGRPLDIIIKRIVRKYTGQEFDRLADIPRDVAEQAFNIRRERKENPVVERGEGDVADHVDHAQQIQNAEVEANTAEVRAAGRLNRRMGRDLLRAAFADLSEADITLAMTMIDQHADSWAVQHGYEAGPASRDLWWATHIQDIQRIAEEGMNDQNRLMQGGGELFQIAPPVEVQEFRDWFGGSAVVDNADAPMLMYHGTKRAGFTEFGNASPDSLFGPGFYFTDNPGVASGYAKMQPYESAKKGHFTFDGQDTLPAKQTARFMEYLHTLNNKYSNRFHWFIDDLELVAINDAGELNARKAYDVIDYDEYWDFLINAAKESGVNIVKTYSGSAVYPVYLSIKNPFDIDAPLDPAVLDAINVVLKRRGYDEIVQRKYGNDLETGENLYRRLADRVMGEKNTPLEEVRDILKEAGFDGITHIGGGRVSRDGPRHRVYIAFDSNQVKSVYNRGTYGPTGNLLEQTGAKKPRQGSFFEENFEDLPLFSGNPDAVQDSVFQPGEGIGEYITSNTVKVGRDVYQVVVENRDTGIAYFVRMNGRKVLPGEMRGLPQQIIDLGLKMVDAENIKSGHQPMLFQEAPAVETTAFEVWNSWDWINDRPGNYRSAVVNPDGSPITVFHGSPYAGFGAFQPGKATAGLYGKGFYFTEDVQVAGGYMNQMYPVGMETGYELSRRITFEEVQKLKKMLDIGDDSVPAELKADNYIRNILLTGNGSTDWFNTVLEHSNSMQPEAKAFVQKIAEMHGIQRKPLSPGIIEAHLSINNPFSIDARFSAEDANIIVGHDWAFTEKTGQQIYDQLIAEGYEEVNKTWGGTVDGTEKIKNYATLKLQDAGYDGITHIGGNIVGNRLHRVWIAFWPEQVKSTNNNGGWSTQDSRMLYQLEKIEPGKSPNWEGRGRYENGKLFSKSGREIPMPDGIRTKSERTAKADIQKVNQWLIDQAKAEAQAVGDTWFLENHLNRMVAKQLHQADLDTLNEYILGVDDVAKLIKEAGGVTKAQPELTPAENEPLPIEMFSDEIDIAKLNGDRAALLERMNNAIEDMEAIIRSDPGNERVKSGLEVLKMKRDAVAEGRDYSVKDITPEIKEPDQPAAIEPPDAILKEAGYSSRDVKAMTPEAAQAEAARINSIQPDWKPAGIENRPAPNITRAFGPDPNKTYEFRWKVVELNDLVTSHGIDGNVNKNFPPELQRVQKNRGRAAFMQQINNIAVGLVPVFILGENSSIDIGAMIVGSDNVVESGNGRTLALKLAAETYPDQWSNYQSALRERAVELGINLEGYTNPVLVRERITDVDRIKFFREANDPATMRVSEFEQATFDAQNITDDSIINLKVDPDASIDQALRDLENAPFARSFTSKLPDNEVGMMADADGRISAEGLRRIKNAIFLKVYQGDSGFRVAQGFIESIDPLIKNMQSALYATLPIIGKVESSVRKGSVRGDLSIAGDIIRVADTMLSLAKNGTSIRHYLTNYQTGLLGGDLSPVQLELLKYIGQNNKSVANIRKLLEGYANGALLQPAGAGGDLFNLEPVSKGQLLDLAAEKAGKNTEFAAANNTEWQTDGTFYRVGDPNVLQRGKTAADIIKYETEDLGNKLNVTPGINLSEISSRDTIWVTRSKDDAKYYLTDEIKKIDEVKVAEYRILAADDQGGILIQKIKPQEGGQDETNRTQEAAETADSQREPQAASERPVETEASREAQTLTPRQRVQQPLRVRKGGTEFLQDGRAIIRAFAGADATTLVHELGHVFRRDLSDAQLDTVARATGLPSGAELLRLENAFYFGNEGKLYTDYQTLLRIEKPTVAQQRRIKAMENSTAIKDMKRYVASEEHFARGWERYFAEGISPNPEMRPVFAKFSNWMLRSYTRIINTDIDVEVNVKVNGVSLKDIYDQMLTVKPPEGNSLFQDAPPKGGEVAAKQLMSGGYRIDTMPPEPKWFIEPERKGLQFAEDAAAWIYKAKDGTYFVEGYGSMFKVEMGSFRREVYTGFKSEADAKAFVISLTPDTVNVLYDPAGNPVNRFYDFDFLTKDAGETYGIIKIPDEFLSAVEGGPIPKVNERSDYFVYRGLSRGEMENIIASGGIKSRSEYNLQNEQGMTFYSQEPISAFSYADGFAPMQFRPTVERPGYVIEVLRDPSMRRTDYSSNYIYTFDELPAKRIMRVTEIRVTPDDGREYVDVTDKFTGSLEQGRMLFQSARPNHEAIEPFQHGQNRVSGRFVSGGRIIALTPEGMTEPRPIQAGGRTVQLMGIDPENPAMWVILDGDNYRSIPMNDPANPAPEPAVTGDAPLQDVPTTTGEEVALHDLNAETIRPILNEVKAGYLRDIDKRPMRMGEVGEAEQGEVRNWLNRVGGEMSGAKFAAQGYGEMMRDLSLLNYSDRVGADNAAGLFYPYSFWGTRSMMNWGLKALERPNLFGTYARYEEMRKKMEGSGFPSRFRDKMAVGLPFLPDWMGGLAYFDPVRQMFPPAAMFGGTMDMLARERGGLVTSTTSILNRMVEQGTISPAQRDAAIKNKTDEIWKQAYQTASEEAETQFNNPADVVNTLFSPALWWTLPKNIAGGTPEKINPLPSTRFGQALQATTKGTWMEGAGAVAGGLLAGPERAIRKAAGISEYGEWGDYYVDRILANMAADGTITTKDALIAMVQRSGPAFDQAYQRAAQEQAFRVPGMAMLYGLTHGASVKDYGPALVTSLFPVGLHQSGELKLRGLKDEYDNAWKEYKDGKDKALTNFYNEHPEYSARLALWDTPEERLRNFLVDEVWEKYNELERPNKSKVVEQLGTQFERAFLDKNTQDYSGIDINQLAAWAKMLGGDFPIVPETKAVDEMGFLLPELDKYEPALAKAIEGYQAERDLKFPGWYMLQSAFFNLPEPQQAGYLTRFPLLQKYWDWKKQYEADHPELSPYFKEQREKYKDSTSGGSRSSGGGSYSAPKKPPVKQFLTRNELSQFSAPLLRQLTSYFLGGISMGEGANAELERLWKQFGEPNGDISTWLDTVVSQSFH